MNKILIILSLVLLASCSPKEVPSSDLVERQGVTYEINSKTPFTGIAVEVVEYHENGQLTFKSNYKDGIEDGLQETYHDNGQLMTSGNYKDGKEDGLSAVYDDNGQLLFKHCFKNGERTDMSYCEK